MHELRRRAYLEAIGVTTYVSRHPLPGAMASRKWVVERAANIQTQTTTAKAEPVVPAMPQLDTVARPRVAANTPVVDAVESAPKQKEARAFSFVALKTGRWLWLEELPAQQALMRDQVLLVQAIARALGWGDDRPEVSPLFNWPMHNNQQLDQGEDAAKAALGGFIRRRLDDTPDFQGVVILGSAARQCVPLEQLGIDTSICIASTMDMLRQPTLKKQVWHSLRPYAD